MSLCLGVSIILLIYSVYIHIKCHLHFSSSAMNGKDYQKMFEDAERQREAGETPPPSTSPIHMHEHNNNNNNNVSLSLKARSSLFKLTRLLVIFLAHRSRRL